MVAVADEGSRDGEAEQARTRTQLQEMWRGNARTLVYANRRRSEILWLGQRRNPCPSKEHQVEDRGGPNIAPQLDFAEQFANLGRFQPLRRKRLPTQLLDLLRWIGSQPPLLNQPAEVTAKADQSAIDRCNRLLTFLAEMTTEVRDIGCGNAARVERLCVDAGKPLDELAEVEADRCDRTRREVLRRKVRLRRMTCNSLLPRFQP